MWAPSMKVIQILLKQFLIWNRVNDPWTFTVICVEGSLREITYEDDEEEWT